MKRRRVLLGVLATLGLALVGVAVALWALEPAPGVTEANVRRLRGGMSRDRVERLLGGPGAFERNTDGVRTGRIVWKAGGTEVRVGFAFFGMCNASLSVDGGPPEELALPEPTTLDALRFWFDF